jgi:hypothetical protein
MAIYREGNYLYTPVYPDKGMGVMANIYQIDGTRVIFSTQPHENIEDVKAACKFVINAMEEREQNEKLR